MVTPVSAREAAAKFSNANARLFVCGGYGGHVTYDGRGGPMFKAGAPMDRLFLLREDCVFEAGDALSIDQGHLSLVTGSLSGSTNTLQATAEKDTTVEFIFEGSERRNSIEIRGAIHFLGVPPGTILISGDIAPSQMRWEKGDVTGRPPMLPYTAYHFKVDVCPALRKHLGIKEIQGAMTGWPKIGADADFTQGTTGAAFQSQQILGLLSVFCTV